MKREPGSIRAKYRRNFDQEHASVASTHSSISTCVSRSPREMRIAHATLTRPGSENPRNASALAVCTNGISRCHTLQCNPHLHVVFLDGVCREVCDEVPFRELPRLSSTEVGDVLADSTKRMAQHLRRKGLLQEEHDESEPENELAALTASAVSGALPPAGPELRRGALPLSHIPIKFDKPLCAELDGFTLHAATRAGALDLEGRETLLKYILRPAVAHERVTHAPGGLVRITLKRPFSDGTVAVDRSSRGSARSKPA